MHVLMQVPSEPRKGCQTPCHLTWVLGTEFDSCRRAASVLYCSVISLVPDLEKKKV